MNVFVYLGILVGVLLLLLLLILLRNIYEVKTLTGGKSIPCTAIFYLVVIIIIIPLTIFYVIFFALYRKLVSSILKNKYKSKFLGLVRSGDAFHTMIEPSNSLIHTLVMWEDTRENPSQELLQNELKKIAYDLLSVSPIIRTTFKTSFGYTYMLREKVTMDDCVKTLKIAHCGSDGKISKEQLLGLINECHTSPLPKNDSVWGEALVGTQPVNWKDDGKSYYPLFFRTHHGICGGVTLMKVLTGSFADYTPPNDHTQKLDGCVKNEKPHPSPSWMTNLLMGFRVWLVAPAIIYSSLVAKGNDSNILCGRALSNQVNLGVRVEDSPGYIQKIKRIKEKVPGVSFSEVVLAAFSASLAEYFGKNSTARPEFTTSALPLLASAANLHRLVPGELDVRGVNMENNHSMALMNLPMFVNGDELGEKSALIKRLKLINKESTIFRNSVSHQVNRVLMLLCGFSPQLVIRIASHIWRCTTLISIVPGTQKVTYKQGSLVLADLVYWIPHLYSIGVGLSVLSYDGRLQVGFRVDKALISDAKDVQSVVDGVYRYIDLLEQEIDSTCHNK